MGSNTKIRIDDALRDHIADLQDAVVVPPEKGGKNAPVQRSGVFDATGQFVTASITMRPNGYFNSEPPHPDQKDIQSLQGSYMYGGVLFGHFGHFLMDSLARIWALDELRDKIDGVIFTPKTNAGNIENMLKVQSALMRPLGMTQEIKLITDPTRVERLFVPHQGIGIGSGWEMATPKFRAYMAKNGGKHIEPNGPEKIYLSRSNLPKGRASFLSEKILEKNLEKSGYAIIHPEKLSKEAQVALYRSARQIISPDGSPLHLLAYVGHAGQDVAVIARRSADTHSIFERQLSAFTGARAITVNCLQDDWLPNGVGRPGRMSWGELDMVLLFDTLRNEGFLPPDAEPWAPVTEAEIHEEIELISKSEGKELKRHSVKAT